MKWNEVAKVVENDFGMQVDWEEKFFVCPECGEPVLDEDWPEYNWDSCPICGFKFFLNSCSICKEIAIFVKNTNEFTTYI